MDLVGVVGALEGSYASSSAYRVRLSQNKMDASHK